ncbi:MAG: hypothetical protein IKX16_04110 [Clostridia bacterium]|nr:hypothetical protein [Clostridia bacterium]
MSKRILVCIISTIIIACITSCNRGKINIDSNNTHNFFIQRSYWLDNDSLLPLTFYYTSRSFISSSDEIEECCIGNGSGLNFDCSVCNFSISETPIYMVDKTEYYKGNLVVQPKGLNASIGDTVLTVKTKEGVSESFHIGNIAYEAVDETANTKAQEFIEYALINPAMCFEDGRPRTPAFAVEMNVLKDITVTRFASASDKFGFDLKNAKVYSYDEYMTTVSEPLENMELDKIIPDIYDRKVSNINEVAGDIDLKAGVYYVIVPLVQFEPTIPEPIFSGIDICFNADGGNYMLHVSCNPLFAENFHVQGEVLELFD